MHSVTSIIDYFIKLDKKKSNDQGVVDAFERILKRNNYTIHLRGNVQFCLRLIKNLSIKYKIDFKGDVNNKDANLFVLTNRYVDVIQKNRIYINCEYSENKNISIIDLLQGVLLDKKNPIKSELK